MKFQDLQSTLNISNSKGLELLVWESGSLRWNEFIMKTCLLKYTENFPQKKKKKKIFR